VSVGLVEACESPRLIGLMPHPAQRELLERIADYRTVIGAAGRRFGKTKAVAAAALYNLLLCPEADKLVSRGEKRYAISVANSIAQSRIFLEHARVLVEGSPTLRDELVDIRANEIEFRGGRILAAFPCTAKSTRGYAASFVCLDEFAHFTDIEEGGPAVAARIWASVTPSVIQFGKFGKVVAISTPLGSDNLFADLYAKARGGEIPEAAAFHAPSWANPQVDEAYLEAQRVALGTDDFAREFGAEFVSGGASFIEESAIRACVAEWREVMPGDGRHWTVAFDPSFSSDPAAVAVVGRAADDPGRLLVGHVERWLPPRRRRGLRRTRADEDLVIGQVLDGVAAVAGRYGVGQVISDQHLPGTVTHELAKRGLAASIVPWTSTSKTQAFAALRARVHTRRIELPNDPVLVAELCRLRSKVRAGSSSVETPKVGDSHCDVAVAVAAAVARLDRGAGVDPVFVQLDEKRRLERWDGSITADLMGGMTF
jgi:phage terminase large subunit-like protein